MIKGVVYWLFLLPFSGWGQITIHVNVEAGGQIAALNQPIQLNEYSFQLEQVRFYLSNFEFYQNGQLMAIDSRKAYLIDLEADSTRKLVFPDIQPEQIDEIRFLVGIDSITNTSGAMAGALDPMHGMYWSWQSGYINCKLEGKFLNPGREEFQLHLGGYVPPFSGAQQIILKNSKTATAQLNINLDPLMTELTRSKEGLQVMSPCTRAVAYTQLFAKFIELKP